MTSEELKAIREKLGLSQKEMADRLGMQSSYLSRLENGSAITTKMEAKVKAAVADVKAARKAGVETAPTPAKTKGPRTAGTKAVSGSVRGRKPALVAGLSVQPSTWPTSPRPPELNEADIELVKSTRSKLLQRAADVVQSESASIDTLFKAGQVINSLFY